MPSTSKTATINGHPRLMRDILEGKGTCGMTFVIDYIIDEALSYAASMLGRGALLKLGNLLVERTVSRML